MRLYKSRNKRHAIRTECATREHRPHHSGAESAYCDILRIRKLAGEILDYETQAKVALPGGDWRIDFVIWPGPGIKPEFHEVKGMLDACDRRKIRELRATYPHTVLRVLRRVGRQWKELVVK